jgi:hypothetical protein
MRVTRQELASLRRRREQPTRAEGELLAIFVSGRLLSALNAPAWIWQKRQRYAKQWRARVAEVLLEVGARVPPGPKHVTFLAATHNRMDSDNLAAALKPIRDALVECRVLSGDAEQDGNTFDYQQKIDRTRRGVEVRVRPRSP